MAPLELSGDWSVPVARAIGGRSVLQVSGTTLRAASAAALEQLAVDRAGTSFAVRVKGRRIGTVLSDGDDGAWIAQGIGQAYRSLGAGTSRVESSGVPLGHIEAAAYPIEIRQYPDSDSTPTYELGFLVTDDGDFRGHLFQEPPAILNPVSMERFLRGPIAELMSRQSDEFRISIVVGGTSAESALLNAAEADLGKLDSLPSQRDPDGGSIRSHEMEALVHQIVSETRGSISCAKVRFVRSVRHGGSLPIGVYIGEANDIYGTVHISDGSVEFAARALSEH